MNIQRVLKAPQKPVDPKDFASLQYPLYASRKKDGIRCIIHPTLGPVTQSLKPIRNKHVRDVLNDRRLIGFDGELVTIFSDGTEKSFNQIQSEIMSEHGIPNFRFLVFDCFHYLEDIYEDRKELAQDVIELLSHECIEWLPQYLCKDAEIVQWELDDALREGEEGLMLRSPTGIYKQGRSTLREGIILKVKPTVNDAEAVVIGLEEQLENCNLATLDVRGYTKRSKHSANLVPKGCVGKLVCRWNSQEIKIGSGFTDEERHLWWSCPNLVVGKTITFKYQAHGMKNLPRQPIFKGIRYDVT